MPTSFDVLLKNWLTKISNSIKGISVSGDTLTVTKTDNSTEDLTLGLQALEKKIFAQSTWYKRPQLMTTGTGGVAKREIRIPKGTQVAINNNLYVSTQDVTLDASVQIPGASNRAGKDVYVYACVPTSGTEPVFVLSLNSTVPTGYTADTSRKIGGFHCLCADVGTIADHPLSGYLAGDILPLSVWDLLHRAVSENIGMVYVNGTWYDIYQPHWDSAVTGYVSTYNSYISNGVSGEMYMDTVSKTGKRMLSRDEFIMVSDGSNQMTNIMGNSYSQSAGNHVDTAGRRMISNYGLEDCCGNLWQWTSDIFGASNDVSSTWSRQGLIKDEPATTSNQYSANTLVGYALQTDGRGTTNAMETGITEGPTYNKKGLAVGALARALVGGDSSLGVAAGSRCVKLNALSSNKGGHYTTRLASNARIVNL